MAKREADFTTQLIASLDRAGCRGVFKIPDMPHFKGMRARFDIKKPCDVIGAMPNGLAIHIEVKQRKVSDSTGLAMGINPVVFRGHQLDHLRQIDSVGALAIVAVISWSKGSFFRLYTWTWPQFAQLTNDGTMTIPSTVMRTQRYLERLKPGDRGWDMTNMVAEWMAT